MFVISSKRNIKDEYVDLNYYIPPNMGSGVKFLGFITVANLLEAILGALLMYLILRLIPIPDTFRLSITISLLITTVLIIIVLGRKAPIYKRITWLVTFLLNRKVAFKTGYIKKNQKHQEVYTKFTLNDNNLRDDNFVS